MSENNENKLVPKLRFPNYSENWTVLPVSEMFEVFRGSPLSKIDLEENGTEPCIHYGELFTKYNEVILATYSKTNRKNGFRSVVGDVLMPSSDVTLTGLAKASAIMLDNVILGGDMNILRPQTDINSIFLSYLLNRSKREIIKLVSGTTVKHIYPSQIITCRLPIIKNSDEQQKIAACLSSLDEVIAGESQKLELLKEHKKGLLQNLFPQDGETVPKLRFKEFVGNWKNVQLGSLIEIKGRIGYRGYTTNDIVEKGQGAITFSPSNIDDNNQLNFNKATYISWDKYFESPEIMLQDGYTVLVKTGSSFGKAVFIKNLPGKTTINPQLVVLKPININPKFLFLLVCNSAIQRQIKETVVGGAIPTLSQESISRFEILIPPDKNKKEQEKIADTLSSIDDLINSQSQKIETLKLHKKGLLQGLFPPVKEDSNG